ncbi:MAG: Uma2 family endonuclease [Myxococcota bacterium]
MASDKQGVVYYMSTQGGGYGRGDGGSGYGGGMSALGGGGGGGYSSTRVKKAASAVEDDHLDPMPPVISEAQLLSDWRMPPDSTYQLAGVYTLEQFHALQERLQPLGRQVRRLELLDGEVFVSSSAREPHAVAISNLMVSLTLSVRRQHLGTVYTEFALLLDKVTEVMPDLIFATEEDLRRCEDKGIRGPARLVVEVLSPSTRGLDRTRKKQKYLASGVQEYWLVDPDKKRVQVFLPLHLTDPSQVVELREGQRLTTSCIPRWSLPVEAIFDRTWVHEDPEAQEIADNLQREMAAQQRKLEELLVARTVATLQLELLSEQLSDEKAERQRAEADKQQAEAERQRAEADKQHAEQAAQDLAERLASEQAERVRAQAELEQLRAQLVAMGAGRVS